MGFLSGLLGTVANTLLGGILGGSGKKTSSTAPLSPVVDIGDMGANAGANDLQLQGLVRGYLEEMSRNRGKGATTYSAQAALGAGPETPGRGQVANNQLGGMAYPETPGQGLFAEKLGPGRGGLGRRTATSGATATETASTEDWKSPLLSILGQRTTSYAAPLTGAFQNYMQRSLAGENGLPQDAYNRAFAQGQSTINAQAQQSRGSLAQTLGSRGLGHSGLMAQGLAGVENARLGSMGSLSTGLATQNLQAARESQSQAASLLPSLAGIDQQGTQSVMQGYLAMRQLDLQAQQIGLSQQAIDNAKAQAGYQGLASLIGAYVQYRNQPTSGGGTLYTDPFV